MDWQQIKEKYPNAWEAFLEGISIGAFNWTLKESGLCQSYTGVHYNDRDLYSFFDERGIYLFIAVGMNSVQNKRGAYEKAAHFSFEVVQEEGYYEDSASYPTRSEAEQSAFTKAFSILEQQLTN